MKKFLICLAPSILAYLIVIVAGASSSEIGESLLGFLVILILVGALLSGGLAAISVYKKMETEKGVKVCVSVLCFLGVGVAYFAVSLAGCCGLAALSLGFN